MTLRYGVIGVNGVGKYHARWAMRTKGVTLAAIADVQQITDPVFAEVPQFRDYREMLAANCVDAVSVCTPHHLLAPISAECLGAGLHVLAEKPLALRCSEIDLLIEKAAQAQRQLAVCFQYRTYVTPRKMKAVIDSGELGQLRRVLWTWCSFRTQHYYERATWRTSWAGAGGGLLMNQVSHDLDLMCWLFGKPKSVTAQLGNQLGRVGLEDVVSATVRFESGLMATFQGTMNEPEGCSIRHVVGDTGVLRIDEVQSLIKNKADAVKIGRIQHPSPVNHPNHHFQSSIKWRTESSYAWPWWTRVRGYGRISALARRLSGKPYRYPIRGGHSVILDNFAQACRGEVAVLVSAESARQTIELINAIYYSAFTKQSVELPLDARVYDKLFAKLTSGDLYVD